VGNTLVHRVVGELAVNGNHATYAMFPANLTAAKPAFAVVAREPGGKKRDGLSIVEEVRLSPLMAEKPAGMGGWTAELRTERTLVREEMPRRGRCMNAGLCDADPALV